jgi:4-hydroxythreonine-4-phosphate dehydrogenase
MKPTIAITMGDPCGVGPEIVLKAVASRRVLSVAEPVIIGDYALLNTVAGRLSLRFPKRRIIDIPALGTKEILPGRPTKKSGAAMLRYVEEAVGLVQNGKAAAIVTAPINKAAALKAGFAFPGHTEFLAHLTGAKEFCMMLGGADLKVVLVTIHEPIKRVPSLITTEAVLKSIRITDRAFKREFGMARPRIAVAGLNPHAGEEGAMGSEEQTIIAPAVKRAARAGIDVTGPLPADTLFYRAARKKEFDVVIAMYHDQGLGPLKLLHFEDGINCTLGLPIIRTSVDHGTAYDIAWQGKASHLSLVNAITTAADMAHRVGKG